MPRDSRTRRSLEYGILPKEYLEVLPRLTREEATILHGIIERIREEDNEALIKAGEYYGDSWCQRGGPGAWMVSCRKFDRLEQQLAKCDWNIFKLLVDDEDIDGPLDDIEDLCRYLILIRSFVQLVKEKKSAAS